MVTERRFAVMFAAASGAMSVATTDALIVAVCVGARALPVPMAVAWLGAVVAVSVGSYLLFGLPQILLWERTPGREYAPGGRIGRKIAELLDRRSAWVFVPVSILTGPVTVAAYFGAKGDPHVRRLTAFAAVLMALFWTAFYSGLIAAVVRLFG